MFERYHSAPLAPARLRIHEEDLRDAMKAGLPEGHDPFLVAMTPGAAEAIAAEQAAAAPVTEAQRARQQLSRDRVREFQHPHTPHGRMDEIRAEFAAADAVVADLAANRHTARVAVWRLLYVVDDATYAARRKAFAARVDEQHARAVQALADLKDALKAREAAYAAVGHPGDRAHWSYRRPTEMGNIGPSQVFTEPFRALDAIVSTFPADVAVLAEADEVKP